VLACAPAFCQDDAITAPGSVGQKLNDNLRQRLNDILNPQHVQASGIVTTPQVLRLKPLPNMALSVGGVCSIPLLSAVAPGKPVPMPTAGSRQIGPGQTNMPRPIDRMKIVAPAPACPANFGQVQTSRSSATPATRP